MRKSGGVGGLESTKSKVFRTRRLEALADELHAALLATGLDTSVPAQGPAGQQGSKVRLPLTFFDNVDLERHDGPGWAAACAKLGREPNAVMLVPDAERGGDAMQWKLGRVTGWDEKSSCFSAVRVDPSGHSIEDMTFSLPRLSVMFLAEPMQAFVQRLSQAHRARDECEAMLLLQVRGACGISLLRPPTLRCAPLPLAALPSRDGPFCPPQRAWYPPRFACFPSLALAPHCDASTPCLNRSHPRTAHRLLLLRAVLRQEHADRGRAHAQRPSGQPAAAAHPHHQQAARSGPRLGRPHRRGNACNVYHVCAVCGVCGVCNVGNVCRDSADIIDEVPWRNSQEQQSGAAVGRNSWGMQTGAAVLVLTVATNCLLLSPLRLQVRLEYAQTINSMLLREGLQRPPLRDKVRAELLLPPPPPPVPELGVVVIPENISADAKASFISISPLVMPQGARR